jgi:hypothetical protein
MKGHTVPSLRYAGMADRNKQSPRPRHDIASFQIYGHCLVHGEHWGIYETIVGFL